METEAGEQSENYLIIVDDESEVFAYPVERFEVDIHKAVLRPVFNQGQTTSDYSIHARFRLVGSSTKPSYVYQAAQHFIAAGGIALPKSPTE